jgi:phage-related protein
VKIRFFVTGRGDAPVQEYIDALEERDGMRVDAALDDIREKGLRGTAVPLRQIRGKLWEIKIQPHRIFYAVENGGTLWLLHAYRKRSQKAPKVEIETALMRLRVLLEREEEDESATKEELGQSRARRR